MTCHVTHAPAKVITQQKKKEKKKKEINFIHVTVKLRKSQTPEVLIKFYCVLKQMKHKKQINSDT